MSTPLCRFVIVYLFVHVSVLTLAIHLSRGGGIPLISLNSSYFCACPKQEPMVICHGLLYVQWFEMSGSYLFCDIGGKVEWPSLFKLSFYSNIVIVQSCTRDTIKQLILFWNMFCPSTYI